MQGRAKKLQTSENALFAINNFRERSKGGSFEGLKERRTLAYIFFDTVDCSI